MENPPLLSEIPSTKYFQLPKQNFSCVNCKKPAKYQCPKCKFHYCELLCYKNHNSECTEEFYKEQVTQHLKGKKVSEAEMKKMKRILEKYKDNETIDEPSAEIEESLLNKKIARLNELKEILETGELNLEKLSPEEQIEFGKFIEEQKNKWKPWRPYWWREEFVPSLILLDSDDFNNDESQSKSQKKLQEKRAYIISRIEKLPDFKILAKNGVNPELQNHFMNIIYGGCFIFRLFNGDLLTNSEEALGLLINVSKCLQLEPRSTFGSLENAFNKAIEASIMTEGQIAKDFIEIIFEDLIQIFKNKFFAFEILFGLYDLCHKIDEPDLEIERKKILGKIKQKLIFFMSFYKYEVSFSLMEKWRSQIQDFQKYFEANKSEAQTLGYYKKLNLLV